MGYFVAVLCGGVLMELVACDEEVEGSGMDVFWWDGVLSNDVIYGMWSSNLIQRCHYDQIMTLILGVIMVPNTVRDSWAL